MARSASVEPNHRKFERRSFAAAPDRRRGRTITPRLVLSASGASIAERLLGQQLWCWGRDVVYPAGNLLVRYGFSRHRAPGGDGATCYRLDSGARHIALWAFGIWYGRRELGGIYVNRFQFVPQWANFESLALGIHRPEDVPPGVRPLGPRQWKRAHRLCRELLAWIAGYERWVRREAGLDYRRQCVATWLRPLISAERLPAAWRLLQGRCWDADATGWNEAMGQLTLSTYALHGTKS